MLGRFAHEPAREEMAEGAVLLRDEAPPLENDLIAALAASSRQGRCI